MLQIERTLVSINVHAKLLQLCLRQILADLIQLAVYGAIIVPLFMIIGRLDTSPDSHIDFKLSESYD